MPEDPKLQKLLAAARQEFLEFGYARTAMDSVARRAQASKTTLYKRFKSKEALFAATIAAECRVSGVDFPPEDLDGLPVDEALRLIAARFLALVASAHVIRIEQVVTGEASHFPEVAETYMREGPNRVQAAVAAYLKRATEKGQVAISDLDFAAQNFLASLHALVRCAILNAPRPSPDAEETKKFITKTVALFLDGVRKR